MSNKSKNWLLSATVVVLAVINAQAQYKCGVSLEDGKQIMEQMLQNRIEMQDFVRERNAITYIPVRFILVAKSDGTGRASEFAGLRALCLLNQNYEDQNMQFYLKEFKYINSNTIYSDPSSDSGFNAIGNQMQYNAMNIFLVHDMSEEGVLAYYQPNPGTNGNDWIVSLESYAAQDLVLTHEVGHFFSLNHTFYGWEPSGGYDPQIHGNPVGPNSPGGIPNERVDGSNCTIAGDMICDTPADYMFPDNNCSYTMNAKDPNGQLLSPDIHNFMNYVYGCSDYHFTDQQKQEIQNSLFSFNRNYIRPNYTPNLADVVGKPVIVSPQQNELIPTYNSVSLEWTAIPGADKYLLELITSGLNQRIVTSSNTITLTNLLPSKAYLWRVMAYNEYRTCGEYSDQKKFLTGSQLSDTFEIPEVANWSLSPNPVKVGTPFFINMTATETVSTSISIQNMTGQLVLEGIQNNFQAGESSFEMPSTSLSPGIYLVTLRTKDKFETKRLSVVE